MRDEDERFMVLLLKPVLDVGLWMQKVITCYDVYGRSSKKLEAAVIICTGTCLKLNPTTHAWFLMSLGGTYRGSTIGLAPLNEYHKCDGKST